MINLLRAEIFKLQRNKSFWVIAGIVTGISILFHVLIMTDWWMMYDTPFDRIGLGEFNGLSTFTVPLYFNLIVSSLAGFCISTEFSDSGVIRNQVNSGNKRSHIYLAKYAVYSLGSIILSILIPILTAILATLVLGYGEILQLENLMYLCRAYSLFTLQFLGFTAIIMLLAILTEDSGKTIIFSIIFTMIMFAWEKFTQATLLQFIFEHSIFQQFSDVFSVTMTSGELIKSILIGGLTIIIVLWCGVLTFNRKEIK